MKKEEQIVLLPNWLLVIAAIVQREWWILSREPKDSSYTGKTQSVNPIASTLVINTTEIV